MDFLLKQKDEFKCYTYENERYEQMSQKFDSEKYILVQIAFLFDVHAPFNKFLVAFQGDRPLIHIIFTELKKINVAIMKCFISNDVINGKSTKALLYLDVKNKNTHLPLEKIEIGAKTDRLLKVLSPYDQKKGEKENVPILHSNSEAASKKTSLGRCSSFQCSLFASRCKNTGK